MTPKTKALEPKVNHLPATNDYAGFEGEGFENQTGADVMVPLLVLLQDMSPQVRERKEGCLPGVLINSVTEEPVDELTIVPALTQHRFVEWVPRTQGGGFRGVHRPEEEAVQAAVKGSREFGKATLPNGNQLVETFYVYAVVADGQGLPAGYVVIPFTSTKIKVYKRWNTTIRFFQLTTEDGKRVSPPMRAHLVKVSSRAERNAKGDFHNLVLEPARGDVKSSLLGKADPLFVAAGQLRDMVDEGKVKAAFETEVPEGGEGEEAPF